MMVMSMALLTAGRWMLNVATPSETVKDNEFICTPSSSLAPAGTPNSFCQLLPVPCTMIMPRGSRCRKPLEQPTGAAALPTGAAALPTGVAGPLSVPLQRNLRYRKLRDHNTLGAFAWQ